MRVPRCAGLDPEPKRVILREAEVIRASFVYEGKRAGRGRVPGVRRNHIERGLQRSGPPEDAIGEGVSKLGGRYLPRALQRLLLSRARLDLFRFLLQRLTFLARELGNQRVDERAGVRRHQSAARKDG
jgi:hypothetical protein